MISTKGRLAVGWLGRLGLVFYSDCDCVAVS
jgi:hypothetical protein